MDWVLIIFVAFKAVVLATGMFFAIKWHYDQGKKDPEKAKERRAVLRAGVKVVAVFTVAVLCLVLVTFVLGNKLGLDLTLP
ncbi:hypothetical protein DBR37_00930 [Herminiimonas sp. KBW02]|uniref:hypothetical protein n=1 Tax=Herminiimonas sp. KBW02 TaxID=2153363 RepID=UPI000F5A4FC8|nr:hypothetical protein [Herminiimonas sp. KBW02]RQO38494.1 hypothetical protein DBR37_00930 [Herminiimonas sp. KBW02]